MESRKKKSRSISAPSALKLNNSRQPLTDTEGEVRELKREDAAQAVPFSALPEAERAMLMGIQSSARKRGPQKTPTKVAISIRLSADVADGLRATGEGWQRRADAALRSWLERSKTLSAK